MKIETLLLNVKKDVPLSQYTTFGIGGRTKYFLEVNNSEELIRGIKAAKILKIPFFILGNGSNILVSDKGYDGIVIKLQTPISLRVFDKVGINYKLQTPKICVEAGASLSFLVSKATKNSLTGLEWAAGIPGTVGGAVRGNAGGFGSSMSEIVVLVKIFDSKTGRIRKIKNKDCKFRYRESIFKSNSNLVIIEVQIELRKRKKFIIEDEIKKCLDYRRKRQPRGLSAGSVFKNYHIKNQREKEKLFENFPEFKKVIINGVIPAGFLIEKCGLKGKIFGKAMISRVHSNFIINLGKGKALDVKKLIFLAKESVRKKFGISLEEEIEFIG